MNLNESSDLKKSFGFNSIGAPPTQFFPRLVICKRPQDPVARPHLVNLINSRVVTQDMGSPVVKEQVCI